MKEIMIKGNVCQSCGMLLDNMDIRGTDTDGNNSYEYCIFCYSEGSFIDDLTMEEMIEKDLETIRNAMGFAGRSIDVENTQERLATFIPKLKRWRTEYCKEDVSVNKDVLDSRILMNEAD